MKFRILVAIYSVFCFACGAADFMLAFTTPDGNGKVVYHTLLGVLMVAYGVWAIRIIIKNAEDGRKHEEFMRKYGRV